MTGKIAGLDGPVSHEAGTLNERSGPMSDPITRLNAALEGRYRIERQLAEGGNLAVEGGNSGDLTDSSGAVSLARPPSE